MSLYKVIAKDEEGKTVTKTTEAENRLALNQILRQEKLIPVSVEELRKHDKRKTWLFSRSKISLDDMVIMTRQLATMIDAGIPLLQGLEILTEQSENPALSSVVHEIRRDVETGKSFSEAIGKHSHVFSQMYISMVQAGEESGKLEEILDRLALYMEKTNGLIKKVKSALLYPIIVSCIAFLITFLLILKVIPVFKGIFDSFGAPLPMATAFLISLSDFLSQYLPFEIMAALGGGIFLKKYIRTPPGRKQWDHAKLNMPIFGPIFRKVAVSKFTRTFSTLVKSGVPILTSLEIVGKTSGNTVIEEAVLSVRSSIREGECIADPLGKSKVFPPMVIRMIAVGEKSGELEKMLTKVADFYDEQVDAAVKGLTSLIEPLIIAFVGLVIGGIVIAMFLPIFKLTTLVNA
jgi:type IV pilus assembly protein PilC